MTDYENQTTPAEEFEDILDHEGVTCDAMITACNMIMSLSTAMANGIPPVPMYESDGIAFKHIMNAGTIWAGVKEYCDTNGAAIVNELLLRIFIMNGTIHSAESSFKYAENSKGLAIIKAVGNQYKCAEWNILDVDGPANASMYNYCFLRVYNAFVKERIAHLKRLVEQATWIESTPEEWNHMLEKICTESNLYE